LPQDYGILPVHFIEHVLASANYLTLRYLSATQFSHCCAAGKCKFEE